MRIIEVHMQQDVKYMWTNYEKILFHLKGCVHAHATKEEGDA